MGHNVTRFRTTNRLRASDKQGDTKRESSRGSSSRQGSTTLSSTARASPTENQMFYPACRSPAQNSATIYFVASPPSSMEVSSSSEPEGFELAIRRPLVSV